MAVNLRRPTPPPASPGPSVAAVMEPKRHPAIIAAASQIALDGTSWQSFRLGDDEWQREAWRHYDINGHLRFAANWIGNALSRCRTMPVRKTETGEPGDEIKEGKIAEIADQIFGGQLQRSEAFRLQGIQIYTAGTSYTIAEGDTDAWYVASTSQVSRRGDAVVVKRSNLFGGGERVLEPGKDLLIRTWTPHPRLPDVADSSVRAALPILREYEQLTKMIFAQIDSRLAGAGMLFLPSEMDFPKADGDPANAKGLMRVLERNASTALQDRASPRSLVPIMVQVQGEHLDKVKWLTFETPLQAAAMELRKEAVTNLAISLDIPPEVLMGMGDTNHWSAWQIEEQTISLQIVPVLSRMTEALNRFFFLPALEAAGLNADEYMLWYDTSALVVRPNRQADAMALYEAGELSGDELRKAGDWPDTAKPDDKERKQRLAAQLVIVDPSLLGAPGIQAALGVDPTWAPPAPAAEPAAQGELPAEGGEAEPTERALPAAPADNVTPAQNQAALMLGSHLAVLRALELSGKRLLTREYRGTLGEVKPEELHLHIPVADRDHAERLLLDALGSANQLADWCGLNPDTVRVMLSEWCINRMTAIRPDGGRGYAHDLKDFVPYMEKAIAEFGGV